MGILYTILFVIIVIGVFSKKNKERRAMAGAPTYKRPTFTRWLLLGPFSLLVPKKERIR